VHNFQTIRENIQKFGSPNTVLIAVSKTKPVEDILTLYNLGQRDFGENYAQELIEKADFIRKTGVTDISWHFLGHLQSKKAKLLLPIVSTIHSVDSEKLAHRLDHAAHSEGKKTNVFIQVNVDNETTKFGIPVTDIDRLATDIIENCPNINLQGLMCIPSIDNDPKSSFLKMKTAVKSLPKSAQALSMGMSSDYLVALECGATHLRIGSAIFGNRHVPSFPK